MNQSYLRELSQDELIAELKRLRNENKALKQNVERHRLYFANAKSPYLLIEDMIIVDCNLLAAKLFDSEPDEIIGRSFLSLSNRIQAESEAADFQIMEYMKRAALRGKYGFNWRFINEEALEFSNDICLAVVMHNNKFLFVCEFIISNESYENADSLELNTNILDNIEDLYYATDADWKLQIVSSNVEEFTGWTKKEIIGQEVSKLYYNPAEQQELELVLTEDKKVVDYEIKLRNKNGMRYFGSISARYLTDENNNFVGVNGTIRDITFRKEVDNIIDDSRKRYQLLAENIFDVIMVLDIEEYLIQYVSPSIINLTGYSIEETMLHNFSDLLTPDSFELLKDAVEERLGMYNHGDTSDDSKVYEWQQLCKDGSVIWVEATLTFIEDYEVSGINLICVFRNIEQRKAIEKQINEKTHQLEITNSTKDKFFSIIAHDLKNPLSGFRDISSMLYDNYDVFDEQKRKECILMIKNSSTSVFQLLENLLEWSRSQRGMITYHPEEVNLFFIAHNCVELLTLSAEKKSIALINSVPIFANVFADSNLLTTVIRNIMSNSIKFTPTGGQIEIGVADNENSKFVTIFVRDNGIGIQPQVLDKLFRIDKNITSKGTAGESGSGLGLILCKEFIERHGGSIWVESQVGAGSTFYFTLPISLPE